MNKLNEAKVNLKSVIDRLEKSIENKLQQKDGTFASEVSKKMKTLEEELHNVKKDNHDKVEEIDYLREQNAKLQAELGEIQQQNFSLKNKNDQAREKVDAVINEVKTYMTNNEMF